MLFRSHWNGYARTEVKRKRRPPRVDVQELPGALESCAIHVVDGSGRVHAILGRDVHAAEAFLHRLAPVSWPALVFALLLYLGRVACATRAWRNIIAVAYPDEPVPWRGIFGASTAGMAVSSFVPAKGGELLRLDRKSTRLNSSHIQKSRMPSSA